MNWDKILSRAAGDSDVLREIIDIFLGDCPGMISSLQKAIEDRDPARIETAAHKMKGAVAVFDHKESYESAFTLEQMGRDNSVENSEAIFERLKNSLDVLKNELVTGRRKPKTELIK